MFLRLMVRQDRRLCLAVGHGLKFASLCMLALCSRDAQHLSPGFHEQNWRLYLAAEWGCNFASLPMQAVNYTPLLMWVFVTLLPSGMGLKVILSSLVGL